VRREWGIASDDVVILFYGLIRDYKGLQRLVEAFCRLPGESRAFLVVAGGGDRSQIELAEQKLRQATRSHRAALRFGFVPDPDLASLINASDIVAFPYLHIYQSGALMLAMTYGKPVVASDIDGFRDYVGGHDHARLVDTDSPETFAAALLDLIASPVMRQKMASSALQRCESDFSWERIAVQFQDLYD
jgi:glycosyltransferase involved in cell wall biosynthesis